MTHYSHKLNNTNMHAAVMPMKTCLAMHKLLAAFIITLLLISYANISKASSIYKWLDSDGMIHYSHTVPPDVVRNEHQRLNSQAVVVEHIENADVPDMLAEVELTREQQANRIQKRLLLATYDSTDDIDRERDAAMSWLDKEQQISERYMRILRDRLSEARHMYQHLSDDQGLAYSTMQSTIDSLSTSIRQQQQRIQSIEKKRLLVKNRYQKELSRYKEAMALSENKQLELAPTIDYSMN